MRDKSSLLNVSGLDRHLVIHHRQVERRKHSRARKRVERIIEARQRKTVELRDSVQAAIIDAHAPAAVLLAHHHDR